LAWQVPVAAAAKPPKLVVDHHGASLRPGLSTDGGGAVRTGSWVRWIVCCWLPSWIQRAPQLEQKVRRWWLMTMVICADAHSGQRGIRHLLDG
jgi:hypothetical protein